MNPDAVLAAESSLLGAVLDQGRAMEAVADLVTADDFALAENRLVFSAVQSLFDAGRPHDLIAVAEALRSPGAGEQGPNLAHLVKLWENASPAAARRYAQLVRMAATLRRAAAVGADLVAAAQGSDDPAAVIAEAEARLAALAAPAVDEGLLIGHGLVAAAEAAQEAHSAGGHVAGFTLGLPALDAHLGGLEPGQLVLVAARPSVGKTALAVDIASACSADGCAVLFHSLEMPAAQIYQRVLALRSSVPVARQRSGDLTDGELLKLRAVATQARTERLVVDDRPAVTVGQVRARARRMARQGGLDLVVIDYVGLMRGTGDNRTQELGSISRALKGLAKELALPIVVLAQLNRGLESRADPRPQLADLRDSGELEQDADIVLMLHRQERHTQGPEWRGLAEILIRKHRNGPTGEVLMAFAEATGRFSSYTGQNPRAAGRRTRAFAAFDDEPETAR